MKFGRVLIGAALAVVVLSDLFSSWLTTSPTRDVPSARADVPEETCSSYKKDEAAAKYIGSASYLSARPWDAFGKVGNNIRLGVQQLVDNSLFWQPNPGQGSMQQGVEVVIYRNVNGKSSIVTNLNADIDLVYDVTGSLYETPSPIPRLSDDTFGDDNAANRALRDSTSYFALIQVTKTNGGPPESFNYCLSAAGADSGTIDKNAALGWFDQSFPEIKYSPSNLSTATKTTPPFFSIPAGSGGNNRPSLTFKLFDVSGAGNVSYWSFQAYIDAWSTTEKKLPIVFMVDSNDAIGDVYWIDGGDLVNIYSNDETKKQYQLFPDRLDRAIKVNGDSWRDLDAHSKLSPLNPTTGGGSTDCSGLSAGQYQFTGPGYKTSGSNIVEKVTNTNPVNLLPNCLNHDPDPQKSWLTFWGASQTQQSTSGNNGGCNGGDFFSSITHDGLGSTVVKAFACLIQFMVDGIYEPLKKVTQGGGDQIGALECNLAASGKNTPKECTVGGYNPNPSFVLAWKYSLGLINILVILALLAIAFANILHLNINTYTAKKALPGLVIGVVGANASLLLIRFVLDVAKSLQILAFNMIGVKTAGEFVAEFMKKIGETAFNSGVIDWVAIAAFPLTFIIILIFAIFFFYLLFVFAWAMIKRLVYIYGLTVLAPLAFVAYGVPGQQQWFTKWWDMMLRQIFMLPVVFLASALLIKYVGTTIDVKNIRALDVAGLVNMALIFLTALLILRLPGIITKGAVDITNAAKKAFGLARQTPIAATGMMKNRNEALYKRMKKQYGESDARTQKYKDRMGKWGTWRARSNIVANPQLGWSWWQSRMQREAANTAIDTLSSKGRDVFRVVDPRLWKGKRLHLYGEGVPTPEMLKGRRAAMSEKESGAIDRFNKQAADVARAGDPVGFAQHARLYSDRPPMFRSIQATLESLGNGSYDPNNPNSDQLNYMRSIVAASVNDVNMEKLEGLTLDDPITKRQAGVEGTANVVSDWAGAFALIRRQMRQGTPIEEIHKATYKIMMQGYKDFDEGRTKDLPTTGLYDIPRGGGGGGGGPAPYGGGNGGVQNVRVVNPVTLSPEGEAWAGEIAKHAQTLTEKLSSEQLVAINNQLSGAENIGDLLSGEIGDVLKSQLGSIVSSGSGDMIKHIVRAAASGGGVDAIRQKMLAGQAIEQTRNNMSAQATEFSDEQLDRLGEKIKGSTNDAIKEVGTMIAPHLDQLGADPATQLKYAQKIVEGFRQVMTQGPRSVRSYWQQSFGQLADQFAKDQNIDHITPASIASAIAQAESRQAPPPPQQNIEPPPATPPSSTEPPTPTQ